MKRGCFFTFLLFIIAGLMLLPENLLDKSLIEENIEKISKTDIPFLNQTPEYSQEETYDLIKNALVNLDDEVKLSTNLTSDEIFDIRDRVISDNPEIFYLDYENSKYWSNGVLECKYIDSKENIIEKKQKIESKTNYIISKIIKPEMNEFEKELAIHDFIVLNTRYDVKNYENNTIPMSSYNIDGVLLNGVAVCEGYAKAFQMLLNKVGIESIIVSEPRINHAWNIVKIDGEYYHVDVTWNDPIPDRQGRVLHTFFNVSDRKMLQGKHIWDQEKYPACTSEKYSYIWGK